MFDHERIIARLPGPPYQFLDRITDVQGEQWEMTAGKIAEAQYDIPCGWHKSNDLKSTMMSASCGTCDTFNRSSGMDQRVVITGMAVLSPLRNSVPEFWENIKDGRSGFGL